MRRSSRSELIPRLSWLAATLLAIVLPASLAGLAVSLWPPLLWGAIAVGGWPAFILLGLTSTARNNRWKRAWIQTVVWGGLGFLPLVFLAPTLGRGLGLILPFTTALALCTVPVALVTTTLERRLTNRPRTPVHGFGRFLAVVIGLGIPTLTFIAFIALDHNGVWFAMGLSPPLIFAVLIATWRPTRVRGTSPILDSGVWMGQAWIRRSDGIHWVSTSEERDLRHDFRAIGIRPEMAGFSVSVPPTEQPLPLVRIAVMALITALLPLMLPWLVTVPNIIHNLTTGIPSATLVNWLFAHHMPLIIAVLMGGGILGSLGVVWVPFLALKAWVSRTSGGPLRLDGRTVRTADGVFHLGQEGEQIVVRTGLLGTALVLRNARQELVLRGAAPELHGIREALTSVDDRGNEESIPVAMHHLHQEVRTAHSSRDTAVRRE